MGALLFPLESLYVHVPHLPSTHIETYILMRLHKDLGLSMDMCIGICYFHSCVPKARNLQLQTLILFFSPNLFSIYL